MKKQIFSIISILCCVILQAQVKPDIINSSGMSAQYSGGYLAWSVGEPVIGTVSATNVNINQGFIQSWKQQQKTLMLTLWLEGLWNGSNLNKTQDENGDHFMGNKADKINVLLYDNTNYQIVYGFEDNSLSTMGKVELTLQPNYSGSYYIAITHRNHLTTWSAVPVSFAADTIAYNFTTAADKAYGDNQKQLAPGVFGIYAGDVNQDGLVDGSDMFITETDNNNFVAGYIVTDINGDGLVDGSDMNIVETNNNNFVSATTP